MYLHLGLIVMVRDNKQSHTLGLDDKLTIAGTPYMIARIIEFLPPNATPRKGRQVQSTEVQVRISLYYRPSDVSGLCVWKYLKPFA